MSASGLPGRVAPRAARRSTWSAAEVARQATLLLLGLLALFPMYFTLINSLKSPTQYARNLLDLPVPPHPENYASAWAQIQGPLVNSVVVTLVSVLATVLFAALAAYAFALMDFPGRHLLFALTFALLLVPEFLTLIPLYVQVRSLPVPDPLLALILPTVAIGQPFAILVMRAAFERVPRELLEAARIDGAGHAVLLARVVLPVTLPVLVSVAVIRLVPVWNEYLLPSLVLPPDRVTLPVALVTFQGSGASGAGAPNYGALMAAYVLSALPLVALFAFLMRYYVQGVTSGGVKG
ncbi:carbohydrate ABC transporter permease [Deinococcus pimensis]|uniref:carbohydrate ABC transporter permease n=1 Tax=Deinococcus pimensis TaxID=309888 RepID=UPI0004B9288A|nr:carbohydrate ABC transporter permease [Deinococcus pimensis]